VKQVIILAVARNLLLLFNQDSMRLRVVVSIRMMMMMKN
jgi:hypothetical protein